MAVRKLTSRAMNRVWGRLALPSWAGSGASAGPVGEIQFIDEAGGEPELLVKYLFTSDRLSIQVHPSDAAARAKGLPRGKDEAWLIVDAEPGATIGLGLKRPVSRDTLRAAALDGSIESLIEWRPVRAGELIYSPAGTIHAIGAGITLVEVQQNLDLTYRLYDYGRPRELHLEQAIEVAECGPWQIAFDGCQVSPGREILYRGGKFVVERWHIDRGAALRPMDDQLLLIPLVGGARLNQRALDEGSVWRVESEAWLDPRGATLLAVYPGAEVHPALLHPKAC